MALIIFICGLGAPAIARADPSQAPEAGADQSRRDELKAHRDKVVGQIDLMKASDVELQVEVNRLGNLVSTQQGKVDLARVALLDVQSKLGGLAEEVEQGKRDAEAARQRAAARAVLAYMHPGVDTLGAVLQARDYDQAHRRRTIIGEVGQHDQQIIQGYLDAQKSLQAREARLSGEQQRADGLRREQEDSLAELQAAQARQVETKTALEGRIRDFQSEASELAASEANLTAVIRQREAQAGAGAPAPGESAAAPTTATPSSPAPSSVPPAAAPSPSAVNVPATAAPAPTTAKAAPTTTRPPSTGARLAWPLSGPLTSPFGMRWGALHAGIDIGVPIGTPIHAAAPGTVFYCGVMGGYGNVVLIDHGNGLVSLYGHQDRLACSNGQQVSTGQVIGYSGNTGHSTGPHLHFEVRRNGTPVDPMQYLG